MRVFQAEELMREWRIKRRYSDFHKAEKAFKGERTYTRAR